MKCIEVIAVVGGDLIAIYEPLTSYEIVWQSRT